VKKAERTRQHIIEQTAPVFNCKGFAGTSLTDLTEKTGLTKGALYSHFENKEDIAHAAFQYAMDKVRELVHSKISAFRTYKSQLTALLDFYSEYVFEPPVPGGCPLLNAGVEVDDDHSSMRRIVVQEIVKTVDFIETLLANGKSAGEFRNDTKPRELAYTIFCVIEGAIMFSRAERSREPMEIVIAHCKKLLDQICNKSNE
jgi:TetR/AcrR family transcriptional regulator, transcriptional repressor for nem operon